MYMYLILRYTAICIEISLYKTLQLGVILLLLATNAVGIYAVYLHQTLNELISLIYSQALHNCSKELVYNLDLSNRNTQINFGLG